MSHHQEVREKDEWVVHVDIKICGTVVWEGVVNSFENKQASEVWQKKFMEHAPREASTALILADPAPLPGKLADYLSKEVNRFMSEMMEE